MKAVIYCRVSTEEQAQDNKFSLDAQKRLCSEYGNKEGYEIVGIFEDPGKSATNMNRPALQDMLIAVEANDIDIVLVQDTDRLARNTLHHLMIKDVLKKHKTQLVSISQLHIDDSPEGQMMDTMLASFNSFQSQITGRKTKKGLEQKALSGTFPSYAPPGYKNAGTDKDDRIIVLDEERAPFIKKAFEMYIRGMSVDAINDDMYNNGYRTRSGKRMQTSKIYWMLENPFYYGEFRWGGKIHQGDHEPIVSRETWDLAQQLRLSRSINKSYDRKYNFLLAGFGFCQCGRKLTAEHHFKHSKGNKSNRQYSYYHCTRGKKCQESKNIASSELERQVEEMFKRIQFTKEFYDKLMVKLQKYYDNYQYEISKEIELVARKKTEVEKKRQMVENMLFNGTLAEEVYKRRSGEFEAELATFNAEIAKISRCRRIQIEGFAEIAEFTRNIYKVYKEGSYKAKRLCLGFFWEKFIIQDRQLQDAIPTPLFQAIAQMKKPPKIENGGFIHPVLTGCSEILKGDFINQPKMGGYRESNPDDWHHKPV